MVQDWTRDSFPRHQTFQPQYYPADAAARHQSFSSERYASDVVQRHHSFPQERVGVEADSARFQEGNDSRRPPLMQIDEALRTHCGIVAKHYFVAAVSEDGNSMTFFSPSPGRGMTDSTIRQFFDANRYRQVTSRIDQGADPMLDDYNLEDGLYNRPAAFNRNRVIDRRRNSSFGDWSGSPVRQGRKRPRGPRAVNDEDDVPMTVSSRRGIKIGDSAAVWGFYEQRFKNCQQTACKLIAKAWVKAVEPKKQSTHPYTGSDEKAPAWWPKPWGPTKDDKVRHKEPDHLYKRERVHLLAHILRLVVEPNSKQHLDIQKLGLNVKKLEETTVEALSSFFMDNEANAKKRPFLNEIFKVARQEERYKNGEIDGSTEVYVMAEDKMPESYASDTEDTGFIKDEDEHDVSRPKPPPAQCLPHPTSAEPSSATSIRGPTFMNDMTVRANAFPQSLIPEIPAQQHNFVEGGAMSVHSGQPVATTAANNIALEMVASPHDASRRPSVFSDYASPGGNLYSQQWPQASTAANGSSMYPYAQQQTTAQPTPFVGSGVSMTPNQPFIASTFEAPHRSDYDQNGNPIFRSGDLSQAPPVNQQQGYGYTMASDTRGMRVMTQVVDTAGHRPPLQ
ncbi:hypothetical protein TARUN_9412 [Trichoderma arundinaceum]|uniref:Subtelomeric hrmA-associated cluster protein AFUB-079030/YDR124W-like helical bundle domain-containing protein n=1 Tax=Trichoderma arundinaceum TaxID=490622 RepID=A0A395N9Z8_TRIAR|nr:hypothetical protein TARUN_9412 [Trichoderma arundinaceum]